MLHTLIFLFLLQLFNRYGTAATVCPKRTSPFISTRPFRFPYSGLCTSAPAVRWHNLGNDMKNLYLNLWFWEKQHP